ncbi:MAG TPA: MptD family putative ECF transporter S component [Clostridiales bacterium]|nr:MptD family putative ECF transporter S component [Clostridiales bacterium]
MKNERLEGKDLINVGIFTAIYFVIVFVVAMLGYIPIFMPLLCVIGPIIAGIPFMLFLTKVKKFGMILIMSLLMGLLMLLTGMGYYALIVGAVSGLLAELVYRRKHYQSSAMAVLTSGVFSIWIWGNYIPLFTNIEGYFATRQDYGKDYIDALTALMPPWMCPTLLIAAILSGLIGGLLGRAVLKKHFIKAGIV